mgnify:FL=1
MKGIADTGFLVAFANKNDQHHRWAVELAKGVSEPLLTCEPVLAEAAFHLRNTALILDMLDEGLIALAFELRHQRLHLKAIARRFADRQPDLADICLIRMSELFPQHSVLTVDVSDFSVYRRNKREKIPVICPA